MKYTTDGKKEFWLFCLVCLFLLIAVARLSPEPSFRIMESEVNRLETIWRESQANKQTWLVQVQKLKTEAQALRAASETLNKQLLMEREKTAAFQKSFETLENDRLNEIARVNTEKTALEISIEKIKRTRDVYGGILLSLAALFGVVVILKIKRFLP